jgi:uncharacterized membrane protein HdeD (DUF308 family)
VIAFIPIGALFMILGVVLLVVAIRHHKDRQPRYAAMLIGGMMTTAFGIILAGFAFAYQHAAPLDLNASSVPTP